MRLISRTLFLTAALSALGGCAHQSAAPPVREQIVVILAVVVLPLARHGERGRCARGIGRRNGGLRRDRRRGRHDGLALGGLGRLMRAGPEQQQSAGDQIVSSGEWHTLSPSGTDPSRRAMRRIPRRSP